MNGDTCCSSSLLLKCRVCTLGLLLLHYCYQHPVVLLECSMILSGASLVIHSTPPLLTIALYGCVLLFCRLVYRPQIHLHNPTILTPLGGLMSAGDPTWNQVHLPMCEDAPCTSFCSWRMAAFCPSCPSSGGPRDFPVKFSKYS